MHIEHCNSVYDALCSYLSLWEDDGILLKDFQVIDNKFVPKSENLCEELMKAEPAFSDPDYVYAKVTFVNNEPPVGKDCLKESNKESIKRYEEEYKEYEKDSKNVNNYTYSSIDRKWGTVKYRADKDETCYTCHNYSIDKGEFLDINTCLNCCSTPPPIEDMKLVECESCSNFNKEAGLYKDSDYCKSCKYSDVNLLEISNKYDDKPESKDSEETEVHSSIVQKDNNYSYNEHKDGSIIMYNNKGMSTEIQKSFNEIYGFTNTNYRANFPRKIIRIKR